MAGSTIQAPSGMAGLVRYGEEYGSKFTLTPSHVIGFVILVVLFVIALKIFFPITA